MELGSALGALGHRKRLQLARSKLMEETLSRAKAVALAPLRGDDAPSAAVRNAHRAIARAMMATQAFRDSATAAQDHDWVKQGNARSWQRRGFRKMAEKAIAAVGVIETVLVFIPAKIPGTAHLISAGPLLFAALGWTADRMNQ